MNEQQMDLARAVRRRHDADRGLSLDGPGTSSLAAWFLGPKGENGDLFLELLGRAVESHRAARRDYAPDDPVFVTDAVRQTDAFQATTRRLEADLDLLLRALRGSIPLASYRNQSHMYWDVTMPALLGYFAAMLYNQNNVALEASPVTTYLETLVGDDLCRMLGFATADEQERPGGAARPWGHVTCDGSVANLESMWAARNLKYYPVSVAAALREEDALAAARRLTVPLPDGSDAPLVELDAWTLLNLRVDDVLALSTRIVDEYGVEAGVLNQALDGYILQNLGFPTFNDRFLPDPRHHTPAVLAPSTAHYSWPKAAALLGLGAHALEAVHVDLDARMDVSHLRRHLDACLAAQRPVLQVVAVIGSTEESAVDPLADVVALREEYRAAGLEFVLHVDGAWGGYFASMLRADPHGDGTAPGGGDTPPGREPVPEVAMSRYVTRQYAALPHADTITVDPHKAGYVPYPAGALCYRDGAMRMLVAFTAPVVYHGGLDPSMGVYGVEGSKPGAAAAGVYLSHRVIRTDRSGYGRLLEKCMWNSKRLYAALATLSTDEDPFALTPFQRLPAERDGASPAQVEAQRAFIRRRIVPKSNEALIEDAEATALLREMGSDQIIVAYSFNVRTADGLNTDAARMAALNDAVFRSLSLHAYDPDHLGQVPKVPLFVTSSSFAPEVYGRSFVDAYARRVGVEPQPGLALPFLISTTMDPWITDVAPTDELPDGNFIPVIVEALRTTVTRIIENGEPFRPLTHAD